MEEKRYRNVYELQGRYRIEDIPSPNALILYNLYYFISSVQYFYYCR